MAGDNQKLTRRRALCLLGAPVIAGATGVGFASARDPGSEMHATHDHAQHTPAQHGGSAHAGFAGSGIVDPEINGFDPSEIVRDFDWGRTTRLASGRVLRE